MISKSSKDSMYNTEYFSDVKSNWRNLIVENKFCLDEYRVNLILIKSQRTLSIWFGSSIQLRNGMDCSSS